MSYLHLIWFCWLQPKTLNYIKSCTLVTGIVKHMAYFQALPPLLNYCLHSQFSNFPYIKSTAWHVHIQSKIIDYWILPACFACSHLRAWICHSWICYPTKNKVCLEWHQDSAVQYTGMLCYLVNYIFGALVLQLTSISTFSLWERNWGDNCGVEKPKSSAHLNFSLLSLFNFIIFILIQNSLAVAVWIHIFLI